MTAVARTRFAILSLGLVFCAAYATADDCDRARAAALQQCKAYVVQAAQTINEVTKATGRKVTQDRADGQKINNPQVLKGFAAKGAQIMSQAAVQCRGTIPGCAKICGETEYCAREIDKMAAQIDQSAREFLAKGNQ